MGDRSAIVIQSKQFQTPITIYGHWGGVDNLFAVRDVLARTDRVGDPSYLTAQIFYEFAVVRGKYDGNLSFGIDAFGGDLNEIDRVMDRATVFVNADTGEIQNEKPFDFD